MGSTNLPGTYYSMVLRRVKEILAGCVCCGIAECLFKLAAGKLVAAKFYTEGWSTYEQTPEAYYPVVRHPAKPTPRPFPHLSPSKRKQLPCTHTSTTRTPPVL